MWQTDVICDGNCFGMLGQGWMLSGLEVGNTREVGSRR